MDLSALLKRDRNKFHSVIDSALEEACQVDEAEHLVSYQEYAFGTTHVGTPDPVWGSSEHYRQRIAERRQAGDNGGAERIKHGGEFCSGCPDE